MKAILIAKRSLLGIAVCALVGMLPLSAPGQSVTLFSSIKYQGQQRKHCVTFPDKKPPVWRPCDVGYGSLYAGDEWDWFQSSGARGNRSVIKDLGVHTWLETITVPIVAPLPKLKPGEQRQVSIDTSGADGADGAPGVDGRGANATPGTNRPPIPSRSKNDGKPKIDPLFVKAVIGHMYVIHVVDEVSDFYALFRVDELLRGDSCLISWKLIDAPATIANK